LSLNVSLTSPLAVVKHPLLALPNCLGDFLVERVVQRSNVVRAKLERLLVVGQAVHRSESVNQ
jgi:hypothetical protein